MFCYHESAEVCVCGSRRDSGVPYGQQWHLSHQIVIFLEICTSMDLQAETKRSTVLNMLPELTSLCMLQAELHLHRRLCSLTHTEGIEHIVPTASMPAMCQYVWLHSLHCFWPVVPSLSCSFRFTQNTADCTQMLHSFAAQQRSLVCALPARINDGHSVSRPVHSTNGGAVCSLCT